MAKDAVAQRKKAALKKVRMFLSHPAQRGRVVQPVEVYKAIGVSKKYFFVTLGGSLMLATEWLTINQSAPMDAKLYYDNILKTEHSKLDKDIKIDTGAREIYVSKEMVSEKISNMRLVGPKSKVKTKEKETKTIVVAVTEKDLVIDRIKNAYVMAAIGNIPNITRIMEGFGLFSEGKKPPVITEGEVRQIMIDEDWRSQRTQYMHRTLDVIPDEVKMVSMIRNVEAQRLLFEDMKAHARNNRQYYSTGRVKSLDGSTDIDWNPGYSQLAALAEVMRRMVDGGGNVNVLIQNFNDSDAGSTGSISPLSRQYIMKLAALEPDQLLKEISQLDRLSQMIKIEKQNLTIEEIENQAAAIPTTGKTISSEKEPEKSDPK